MLNDYFNAYDNWFEYYQKFMVIESHQDDEYELNDTEQMELNTLIENREVTLSKLLGEFDKLPTLSKN